MSQPRTDEEKLAWVLDQCRAKGLRRTSALRAILSLLISADKPSTLNDLNDRLPDDAKCDPATTYRMLLRLEETGLIRRFGLHGRAAHFGLILPGKHCDFLICRDCGKIEELDMHCPVEEFEREVATKSGYDGIYHELEFFGRCPECKDPVA
ncbi:MAG: Fur family transcriptional regulator [Verrucomicrobiota bacterium]